MFLAIFLTVLAVLLLASFEAVNGEQAGKHWALLVAGSSSWSNYRHQADICHAYQVLKKHGIPDERIVVMMTDDIANNDENVNKGIIINHPNGSDVYHGVPKDYTGMDVTPEVFLRVLMGDGEGVNKLLGRSGKVIASGPNDRIFVNFADHGAPGLLAFPQDLLHAKDLHNTIKEMYKYQHYKQMVFYVEACESGSMFDNILEDNINVYATTAANPDESSYATYWDSELNTFLGDVYSVKWMEDSDKENLNLESLIEQFKIVKKETNESHVMEYGDLKISQYKVADFQGTRNDPTLYFSPEEISHSQPHDTVPSEEVPMEILRRRIAASYGAEREKHAEKLTKLQKRKEDTEAFFKDIVESLLDSAWFEYYLKMPLRFTDFTCYRESVTLITKLCPGMNLPQNDYALRKLRVLANICESNLPQHKIWRAVARVASTIEICRV